MGIPARKQAVSQQLGLLAATGACQLATAKQDIQQQQAALGALLSAEAPIAGTDKASAAKDRSSYVCNVQQGRSRISLRSVLERIADTLHSRPKAMLQRATEIEADWSRARTSLLS